ncbi:MAG: vWA domain-containing protein [Planctomycetota bacterium]|jgi:Ca-activated chloride channel family protein
MQFKQYDAFYALFLLVFPVIPVYVWCFWRKQKALNMLAQADLLKTLNPSASLSRQIFKSVLLSVAFAAIVAALTRPAWNPTPREVKRKGRDVVILLDTSRSMLAEDIKPNRLERAKIAIGDLMETIRGDRIGIITFAGSASSQVPAHPGLPVCADGTGPDHHRKRSKRGDQCRGCDSKSH